jgi:hypothetical protein
VRPIFFDISSRGCYAAALNEALLVAKGFAVVGSLIKTDASCRVSLAS